jgi:hypothetical protein
MAAAEGENHPPIPSLQIALPRASGLGFQHVFVCNAEFAQVGVTRNDNSIASHGTSRLREDHLISCRYRVA